ncbi:MAG TPA: lysylphosphatidylglycerol synthase transmembrane domain-containing protein [Candidatus Limnocylindrales bacterium]
MDSDVVTARPHSRGRHLLVVALKLVVSLGLLTLLFSHTDLSSLWQNVRDASFPWVLTALGLYLLQMLVATWRWNVLLVPQGIDIGQRRLLSSYLVATFFNNFLPSNIGGDVIRIRDTAGPAQSRTLAATIVLIDRGIGLMGLVLVAAVGATAAGGAGTVPVLPSWLWAGFLLATLISAPAIIAPAGVARLLQPLTVFHPEWVGDRITRITDALGRFRERPASLFNAFAGAVLVQALLVLFYVAVAHSLNIPISVSHMAVIVPISFVVQMLPVSVNGFGVREATFSFYFSRLGLPIESAMALSLGSTALVMLFSLSGAAVYVARRHPHTPAA